MYSVVHWWTELPFLQPKGAQRSNLQATETLTVVEEVFKSFT